MREGNKRARYIRGLQKAQKNPHFENKVQLCRILRCVIRRFSCP